MAEGNDVFSKFSGGMAEGMKLAMQAEQVKQQREELNQRKQAFELQKNDRITNSMRRALMLNGPAQKLALKRLQSEATLMGIDLPEESMAIIMDDTNRATTISALTTLAGMPDDKRSQAAVQTLAFLQNPDELSERLIQLRGQNLSAAAAGTKAKQEQAASTEAAVQKSREFVTKNQQVAESSAIVANAERIKALLKDETKGVEAFKGASAQTLFAKLLDPASAVREGERENIERLTAGFRDKLEGMAQGIFSGVKLTGEQRKQLLEAVDILANGADEQLGQIIGAEQKSLMRQGATEEQIAHAFVTIPRLKGRMGAEEERLRLARQQALLKTVREQVPALRNASDAEVIDFVKRQRKKKSGAPETNVAKTDSAQGAKGGGAKGLPPARSIREQEMRKKQAKSEEQVDEE